MSDNLPDAWEPFVLGKGWMTKDQWESCRRIQSDQNAKGAFPSLPEVALSEKLLTPDQFAELTSQSKIPLACPGCGGHFRVGGKRPESGFLCPKCKRPLWSIPDPAPSSAPPAPAVPGTREAPAPSSPQRPPLRRGPRPSKAPGDAKPAEVEPDQTAEGGKKKTYFILAGAAVLLIAGVLGIVLASGGKSKPGAPGSADSEATAGGERVTRPEAEARRPRAEIGAQSPVPEGPAAGADEQAIRDIRSLIDREAWAEASAAIRAKLIDLSLPETVSKKLLALRATILDRLTPRYEELVAEAEKLHREGKADEAKARVLSAVAWGVSDLAVRARRDAERFDPKPGPAAPAAGADPKAAVDERAKVELDKVRSSVDSLVRDGRTADAIKVCEAYPSEYRDTASGAEVFKLLERLRESLAAKPAGPDAPAAPSSTTTTKSTLATPVVKARGPRSSPFAPGSLSDEEKAKKQAELANASRKDPKGARKAALVRRQEYMEKLEKETGIYDLTTIVDKGDPSKRVDIVMVTSGYSKADGKKIDQMAEALKNSLLKVDPFQNYPDYINFHRIKIDDPPDKPHIPYQVAQNILTCDHRKALEYAAYAPSFDLVVVMCNVKGVRSTGGPPLITIDADLSLGRTFLHEMGHAFASLSDEYVDPTLAPSRPYQDNEESDWSTNVCSTGNAKLARWHYWTLDAWPAAHDLNRLPPGHKVGCFEGAAYQSKGVWRPEETCLMRTGDKYCVVCFEQVEKKFYRLIAPIDDRRPRQTLVPAWLDETLALEGDALKTLASKEQIGKFEGFWYVDSKSRHANAKNLTTILTLQASELGTGTHEVGLRVDFSNKRIRRDEGWLSSSAAWKIDVGRFKKPKWEGPAQVQAKVGQPLTFDLKIENPDPSSYRIDIQAMPEGAVYEGGKFSWTPAKASQGGWRPKFVLTDGVRSVERSVDIAVLDVGEKNYDPVFALAEPRVLAEGEKAEIPIDVTDVDGDNLVFTSPNLPDGAELDLYDGVLRWTPTAHQIGSFPGIVIEAWDGRHRAKGTIDLVVQSAPQRGENSKDLAVALRSGWPQMRARAVRALDSQPRVFQFMEGARLLRDKSKEVREGALALVQKLQESGDDAFVAMMIRDLAPHAWHFTDHKEILAWLDALAAKGDPASTDTKSLRTALKLIDKYNKDRGAP